MADRLVAIDVEERRYNPAISSEYLACGENLCEGSYSCERYSETISYGLSGTTRGLPHSYRGRAFEWSSLGQLTKIDDISLTYDGYGRRTKKGNTIYTHDLSGRLVRQSNGIEYYYDQSGISGFKHNDTNYLYRKNAQGNITHILDTSGNIVVKYKYDAWGNHKAYDNNDCTLIYDSSLGVTVGYESHIGNLNPFIYKLRKPKTNQNYINQRQKQYKMMIISKKKLSHKGGFFR